MIGRQEQFDPEIVGAGIVGLAHALAAVRHGLSVVVIDRDAHSRAVAASAHSAGFAAREIDIVGKIFAMRD
ncbi:FAD-dependent oxidoreductase [Mesorhizobium helmanticense]|uniref:FAD-dependent oxidoreductase n=1 Tax=Mesorhizobium helmanticense TaxID=1776423 RepID=UPI001ABF5959|nr:FAD-dependent oxidoreductase [Mesorhizobium helmanticense]